MKLFFYFLACAAMALAQPGAADLFEKAPPDVDNSLRERVKAFYQSHIDGTYRKAEKYVAEESQDYFYQIQKPRYDSCETLKIAYTDGFKKATVTEVCKGKWNIGGNDMTVQMPMSSTWIRAEGGEWFWKHTPPEKLPTPFGNMDYTAAKGTGAAAAPPPGLGQAGLKVPASVKEAGDLLMKQVTVDKTFVKLSSYEKSADTITVSNNSGGPVKLAYEYETIVPGFKGAFDKTEIPPGGKAILSFSMNPKDRVAKPTINTRILVEPLMQQFIVKVEFAIPPEIEKLIPKAK